MDRDGLELEFGLHAAWLAEAIASLRLADSIPPACRGTGNPALFAMMADALRVAPGSLVLDLGCGIGGPGAWLEEERGAHVVGIDVMKEGVSALKRLFPALGATVGTSRALPFANDSFDAVWALGVIETIRDKSSALSEVHRVLAPGARFGIYSFVADDATNFEAPMADSFESTEAMIELITSVGFVLVIDGSMASLPDPPNEWLDAGRAARAEAALRHRDDPQFVAVETELKKMSRLTALRLTEPWHFIVEKEAA
jgi:SAM-dependent methyltransferase